MEKSADKQDECRNCVCKGGMNAGPIDLDEDECRKNRCGWKRSLIRRMNGRNRGARGL